MARLTASLNLLRCEKAGKMNIQGKKLPPTEDVFHFTPSPMFVPQLLIWKQAVVPKPDISDATKYGYKRIQDCPGLQIQMMQQSPAAPELLNDLVCDCHPDACAVECSCLENGQPCTAACFCEADEDGEEGTLCGNSLNHSSFIDSDTSHIEDGIQEADTVAA